MARDLSRARAILIGNGSFRHPQIGALPATDCVAAVSELLNGPLCGWPAERITTLDNMATPDQLARRVIAAVRETQDVLLVYYVGHGFRTRTGQLALALQETDRDPETLPHTAMLYTNLADILRGCQAATKLVILDCCHAELGGKVSDLFQGADLADAYPVDGLYFIGASKWDEGARYPEGGKLTYFTQALIEVVQGGIPGQPEELRLDQIFLELRARLVKARLPEPVDAGIRGARQYLFARNAAWPSSQPAPLPEHAEHRRLPGDREVGQTHQDAWLASRYEQGRCAEQEQDWSSAVAHYQAISADWPGYRDVAARMSEAVRLRDVAALQEQMRVMFARREFHAVVGIAERLAGIDPSAADPDGLSTQARQRLTQGPALAAPPESARTFSPDLDADSGQLRPSSDTAAARIPRLAHRSGWARLARIAAVPAIVAAGASAFLVFHSLTTGQPGESGTLIAALKTPKYPPDSVAFSPDGKTLAVAASSSTGNTGSAGNVYIYDLAARRITATLTDQGDNEADTVAYSPDGKTLAVSNGSGGINLWSTATHKTIADLDASFFNIVLSGEFSPDGKSLADGYAGIRLPPSSYIRVWNLSTGKVVASHAYPLGNNAEICIAFSPDGKTLAVGVGTGSTYVWNLADQRVTTLYTLPGGGQVDSLKFSRNGKYLAIAGSGESVYIWDLAASRIVATLVGPRNSSVSALAFSPDGTTLAAGNFDGSTYLWNLATRRVTATLTDPGGKGVNSVAYSPHGAFLATGDDDGNTYLWGISNHTS